MVKQMCKWSDLKVPQGPWCWKWGMYNCIYFTKGFETALHFFKGVFHGHAVDPFFFLLLWYLNQVFDVNVIKIWGFFVLESRSGVEKDPELINTFIIRKMEQSWRGIKTRQIFFLWKPAPLFLCCVACCGYHGCINLTCLLSEALVSRCRTN